MRFRRSEVTMVAGYFVVLIAIGTVGYTIVEGWNLADAFYMTVITITAVGYHEVHPLSEIGREWTVFMLVGGLTGLGMWFALVTASMVRMDIHNTYKRRRTMKKLNRIEDHVIVCGGGKMGQQLLHELGVAKKECVFIERYDEAIYALRKINPDVLIIDDDATDDEVLKRAGIERAVGLVTCLSADTDNLFLCLSARHLNPKLVVVARAEGEQTIAKMYRAGADHVVSPNVTGAVWVASVLVHSSVASFLEVTTKGHHMSRYIDQATIGRGSKLAGLTLGDARIPNKTGLIVIAIRKDGQGDKEATFNPNATTRIDAGDDLIVLGDESQIEKLRAYVA